jgi:DNA-binding LacI/PurR family transcriptional regulator
LSAKVRDTPFEARPASSRIAQAPMSARAGRAVPGSVAITGWDDSEAAAPAGLTTVRQSLRDQGSRCARIALGREPPAAEEPPAWQVIERASTRRSVNNA